MTAKVILLPRSVCRRTGGLWKTRGKSCLHNNCLFFLSFKTSFWGIVIVGGVATVFFCILLAQGVLIAYRRHNAFYPPSNVPPEYQIYPPNASQHHSSKNYKRDKHKKDKSRAPLPGMTTNSFDLVVFRLLLYPGA